MTLHRLATIAALLITALMLTGASSRITVDQEIVLLVSQPDLPWADSEIEANLIRRMTRHEGLQITPARDLAATFPGLPADCYNLEALTKWGQAVGAQYLVVVIVDSERLERRKTIHIPLIIHRYSTMGVIEGELRVLDVSRGKLCIAEPFKFEEQGPRAFQATMEDDIHDPDLHLTAPDKIKFFRHLEEKFVAELSQRIGTVIRMR